MLIIILGIIEFNSGVIYLVIIALLGMSSAEHFLVVALVTFCLCSAFIFIIFLNRLVLHNKLT